MKKIDTEKIKKALGTEESKRILLAHTVRNRNNLFISGVVMVLMLLLTAIVFIQIVKGQAWYYFAILYMPLIGLMMVVIREIKNK